MKVLGNGGMRMAFAALLVLILARVAAPAPAKPSAAAETIACRVMEVQASARFGVRLLIFHYRDAADRDRLGKLLRDDDGATVQFQASGQGWRLASLFRLKVCFGRGLLVFPISGSPVAVGDVVLVRFPASGVATGL
jgi:hypothetical protein